MILRLGRETSGLGEIFGCRVLIFVRPFALTPEVSRNFQMF